MAEVQNHAHNDTSTAPQIVILGGGTAGWMCAAAFSRFLPPHFHITLIESDQIGTVGVGEATIPQLSLFHAGLGIDEMTMMRATQATIKLGIEFEGWNGQNDLGHNSYIHAFGPIARSMGLLSFHHYWLRAQQMGDTGTIWQSMANAEAAHLGRFGALKTQAGQAQAGQSPQYLPHAWHFDASLYAKFLREFAEKNGVKRKEGLMERAHRDGENGDITGLTLQSGETINGDFFIDCSGFRSLLLGDALGEKWQDWSNYLPCNRAIAIQSENSAPPRPYTRAIAQKAGWQWQIPLQHRTGNGHVYASDYLSDDEAQSILLENLDGKAIGEPRLIPFKTGRRTQHWVHNVVAMGLSAGFMEPLESTSIHLVQSAISRLLQLFPNKGQDNKALAAEFNRKSDFEWQSIRDFLVLHYVANGRSEKFWTDRRDMKLPDRLAEKIALFKQHGQFVRDDDELFTEHGWVQVMLGQNIMPENCHPLADSLRPDQIKEFMALSRKHAHAIATKMPIHSDFIAQHCAAKKI